LPPSSHDQTATTPEPRKSLFGFQHIGEQLYNFRQVAIDDVRESHEEQPDNPEHHSSAGLVEVTRMLYVIHGVDKPRSSVRARLAEAHQSLICRR
jgi:hypothetical protein